MLVPFAHLLSQVVAVPEAAVEHRGEPFVPQVFLLLGEGAVDHTLYGLLVAVHHRVDIFRAAGASLYLEHPHAGPHHLVDEAHGLEVLGAHDVFVVDVELIARLVVGGRVGASADLRTLSAVGRAVGGVQAHVALSAHGHAECAVTEHFDAQGLARGARDAFRVDVLADAGHLFHI